MMYFSILYQTKIKYRLEQRNNMILIQAHFHHHIPD